MSIAYEKTGTPRFVVETIDGVEQIKIPAERHVFTALFLLVWLGGRTVGGFTAASDLINRGFQPFLAFWLCGWALGEAMVLSALCWMATGAEFLRVTGSDLEVRTQMLGFVRRKLYRGSDMHDLSSCAPPAWNRYNRLTIPFLQGNKTGSVRFNYGARAVYVAPGLDQAEGQLIVDRLRRRLSALQAPVSR